MNDWYLDDVEKAAHAHPESFFIPSKKERQSLVIGKLVQLHFVLNNPEKSEPRAERMWVSISKVLPFWQGYEGELDDEPLYIKGLHSGEKIKFQPKHVGQIYVTKDDPYWLDIYEKYALVSNMVFEGKKIVRFLYREKPDREEDSGWRLFSGYETDEYNGDAKNVRLCKIGWLVDFDATLLEVFKNDYNNAFERKSKETKWNQVQDWLPLQEEKN
jgi:hypothetical protein